MSSIQDVNADGVAPKIGVYKELRQNPYLLGLSAVSRYEAKPTSVPTNMHSSPHWAVFSSVMIKVSSLEC